MGSQGPQDLVYRACGSRSKDQAFQPDTLSWTLRHLRLFEDSYGHHNKVGDIGSGRA